MSWESILPVLGAVLVAIVSSLITAGFLRRSSKEANDANAFKVVTDQLFALNDDLRTELDEVKKELGEVKATVKLQEKELESTRDQLDTARRINRGLATYIKALLAAWPVGTTPPAPEPPVDWESHL